MILGHSTLENEVHGKTNKAAVAISQLICFNAVKKEKKSNNSTPQVPRHSKKYETAFPLYLGLMLHLKTRKKELVTDLASYGMSVSYDRVREVELSIRNIFVKCIKNGELFAHLRLGKACLLIT